MVVREREKEREREVYCVDALELSERKNEGYGSLGGICRYPAWKKVNKVAGE